MPNVQIRDVPDDVHAALARRAATAGQSLQQYLMGQLEAIAAMPTVDEVLDRIEERAAGHLTTTAAVDALDAERAGR